MAAQVGEVQVSKGNFFWGAACARHYGVHAAVQVRASDAGCIGCFIEAREEAAREQERASLKVKLEAMRGAIDQISLTLDALQLALETL
jgi:hypothetical protein